MNMNILMVTSETVPFSKSGGLADVVGALSQSLSEMGHEIRVFIPSLIGMTGRRPFHTRYQCWEKMKRPTFLKRRLEM